MPQHGRLGAAESQHVTAVSACAHRPTGRSRLSENLRDSLSCHYANTTPATAITLACLPAPAPRRTVLPAASSAPPFVRYFNGIKPGGDVSLSCSRGSLSPKSRACRTSPWPTPQQTPRQRRLPTNSKSLLCKQRAAMHACLAIADLSRSLPTTAFPKNFFCALCNQLAFDSYKLICCAKSVCSSCMHPLRPSLRTTRAR